LYLLFAALLLSWQLESLKERLRPLGEGSSGKFSNDQAAALQGSKRRYWGAALHGLPVLGVGGHPAHTTLCQGRELYLLFAALLLSSWELENLKERLKPLGEGSSGKFSNDQAAALQGCEGAPHD